MANRIQLRNLAIARLKAAKILMREGDYDGAVYIVGYVLELALKAAICKRLNFSSYPDKGSTLIKNEVVDIFKTHDFGILSTLAGLSNELNLASASARLLQNWSDLTTWKPASRYEPLGTYSKLEAERMIEALEEKPDGILTWIRKKRKW